MRGGGWEGKVIMAGWEGLSHTAARKKWRWGGGRAVNAQREMAKRKGSLRAAQASIERREKWY